MTPIRVSKLSEHGSEVILHGAAAVREGPFTRLQEKQLRQPVKLRS